LLLLLLLLLRLNLSIIRTLRKKRVVASLLRCLLILLSLRIAASELLGWSNLVSHWLLILLY
jgi:hypothetical protein